jgi:hypothetical protein
MLGQWVKTQRVWRRKGWLRADRESRLQVLGLTWDPPRGGHKPVTRFVGDGVERGQDQKPVKEVGIGNGSKEDV